MPNGHKVISDHCTLCGDPKATISHVIAGCSFIRSDATGNRVLWRHNQYLKVIIDQLTQYIPSSTEVFVDIPSSARHYGNAPPLLDNCSLKPDVVIIDRRRMSIVIGELSVPMESAVSRRHEEKLAKYQGIAQRYRDLGYQCNVCLFEVSARGLPAVSLYSFLSIVGLRKKACEEIGKMAGVAASKGSQRIFNARDSKEWSL